MLEASSGNMALVEHALEEIISIAGHKSSATTWITIAPILMWKLFEKHAPSISKVWSKLTLKHKKVKFVSDLPNLSFDKRDDVHLAEKSSEKFFKHIVEESLSYFTSSTASDSSDGGMEVDNDFAALVGRKKNPSSFAPMGNQRKRQHPMISLSQFKQWHLTSMNSDQRLRIVGNLMTSYGQSRRKALTP